MKRLITCAVGFTVGSFVYQFTAGSNVVGQVWGAWGLVLCFWTTTLFIPSTGGKTP